MRIEESLGTAVQQAFKNHGGTVDCEPILLQSGLLFDPGFQKKAKETPLERRTKAMKKALEYAGEKFRDAYEPFILKYLEQHGAASAEMIRKAYEKTSNPKPHSKRASGGIFAKLKHQGKIRFVGQHRSEFYANKLDMYELVK